MTCNFPPGVGHRFGTAWLRGGRRDLWVCDAHCCMCTNAEAQQPRDDIQKAFDEPRGRWVDESYGLHAAMV